MQHFDFLLSWSFHPKNRYLKIVSDFLSKDFLTGLNWECPKDLVQGQRSQMVWEYTELLTVEVSEMIFIFCKILL